MHFTIDLPNNSTVQVTAGNPEDVLRALSFAFPGQELWLFACQRGRMCYVDGECVSSVSDFREVAKDDHLEGFSDRIIHELSKQWSAMNIEPLKLDFDPVAGLDLVFSTNEELFSQWTSYGSSFDLPATKNEDEDRVDQA